MPVYFFSARASPPEFVELEARLRSVIPELQRIDSLEEALSERGRLSTNRPEKTYLLLPVPAREQEDLETITRIAAQQGDRLFFIFVSNDISANDYKRLVRLGNADWVSTQTAPQEILDIIRGGEGPVRAPAAPQARTPAIAVFVPGAGGVGNSTLAIEAAVQLKSGKATRTRAICLIDLDFQTSHVSDLLDIDPRLQIAGIARHPERVDAQLCDSFITQHASGLDVLAVPRNKTTPEDINIAALDALFGVISQRYDLILIDLPVPWVSWTRQIIGVADLAIVTGLLTIPGLRQVAETLAAIRAIDRIPPQIVVALNRCKRRLVGFAGEQYVTRLLKDETVFYVREDAAAAHHSGNTGIPITMATPRSAISKDVVRLSSLLSTLKPTRVAEAAAATTGKP